MKSIYLVIICFLLHGCATPNTRLQKPMTNIGLLVFNDSSKICHRHIGFTVFGNHVTPYELPSAYSTLLQAELTRAYSDDGSNVVLIAPHEVPNIKNSSVVRSTWDNSAKIVSQFVDAYSALAADRRLDAVMVVTGEPINGQHGCEGIVNYYSGAKGAGVYPPIIHVFTADGEWAGNIYAYDDEGVPQPADDKVLTDTFVTEIEQLLRSGVSTGVSRFREESKSKP